MPRTAQPHRLLWFLARHAMLGAVIGLLFAAGLLITNVADLGTLFASSDMPLTAGLLFFVFFALTFASLKMGVALMTLRNDD